MTIKIPIGGTVVVHRAGEVDKRYTFRGGPPWLFVDEQGEICEMSPLDEPFHSVTVIDPDSGERTYYTPNS